MRKCLFFLAVILGATWNPSYAQHLFQAPDTVCQKQPIQLVSNVPDAKTHYWGFCSGYMLRRPTGDKIDRRMGDYSATALEVVKEGDRYYGFALSAGINAFFRLDFGTSLANDPIVTNYGTFDNALPENLNDLYIVRDEEEGNWHIFITAGSATGNSVLARVDYFGSLNTVPNIANFGNLQGLLNGPHGLFVEKEGDQWFGWVVNRSSGSLVRLEFGDNVSRTPHLVDMGPSGFLVGPRGLAPIKDNGIWYFFIASTGNHELVRVVMGPSLAVDPPNTSYQVLGNIEGEFNAPTDITIVRDCDSLHALIVNRANHELLSLRIPRVDAPVNDMVITSFGNPGGMRAPDAITRIIRDRDNVYCFVPNNDSTITRLTFGQCENASITYSLNAKPPVYSYDTPHTYNVYYVVDEGLPTMQVECQRIVAMAIPPIFIANDTTICEGDTVGLSALSVNALSYTWSPNYNITATHVSDVAVWPRHSTSYRIKLPYSNGCIVDTTINIHVNQIQADAGPDRSIHDGAKTLLGGPYTSQGIQYAYSWHPAQYLDNPLIPNPTAQPPYDFTYYLRVRDTSGCVVTDTVVVTMDCKELNLPNAFLPGSDVSLGNARFGILNQGLVKLNHFRIFDRWGKQVFYTTDPVNEWDGTINGELAPTGVYIWEVDGFCYLGQRMRKSGSVTLLR